MSQTQTRQQVLDAATAQFARNEAINAACQPLAAEKDQGRRTVRAAAFSLTNGCIIVFSEVYKALGYTVPQDDPFAGRIPSRQLEAEVSEDRIAAAQALLAVAEIGLAPAEEFFRLYEQEVQSAEQGTDLVQLPPPDVDSEQFKKDLADAISWAQTLTARIDDARTKLNGLREAHADELVQAEIFFNVAQRLVKSHGEDVTLAKGEQIHVNVAEELERAKDTPALSEGLGAEIAELFLTMMGDEGVDAFINMELDPTSTGSRAGFLQSAPIEGQMAFEATVLLAQVLERLSPTPIYPCLLGTGPNGAPAIEPASATEPAPATESDAPKSE